MKTIKEQVWDHVYHHVDVQVWDQVNNQVRYQVDDQVWDHVGFYGAELKEHIREGL